MLEQVIIETCVGTEYSGAWSPKELLAENEKKDRGRRLMQRMSCVGSEDK